jgi:ribosome maturation factor RimP
MITEARVRSLIEKHLAAGEIFLVDLSVKPGNRISVFLDGDHGVTIDVCRELNHFLNESLDRDAEDYDLTVSSVGADRPLRLPRQFMKNIGRSLDLITRTGDKICGMVLKADDKGIEVEAAPVKRTKKEAEMKIIALSYDDIKSAKEVITFKQ